MANLFLVCFSFHTFLISHSFSVSLQLCINLWLTTILKSNTVQSVPEKKSSSSGGCQSCGRWMLMFITTASCHGRWEPRGEHSLQEQTQPMGAGFEVSKAWSEDSSMAGEKHLLLSDAYMPISCMGPAVLLVQLQEIRHDPSAVLSLSSTITSDCELMTEEAWKHRDKPREGTWLPLFLMQLKRPNIQMFAARSELSAKLRIYQTKFPSKIGCCG